MDNSSQLDGRSEQVPMIVTREGSEAVLPRHNDPHGQDGWLYESDIVDFAGAWDWQQQQVQARLLNPMLPDLVWFLQHPPVYTLGKGASLDHLKFPLDQPPAPLYRIERGGEVTYHCLGQLVVYPILNLNRYRPDLHWYLRQLEAVVIGAIATFGLPATRIPGLTGVWVHGMKVAAIGIKVRRWITMHGVAINVCPDMKGFEAIVPCGIGDRPVGSLDQLVPGITVAEVQQAVKSQFPKVFGLSLVAPPADCA
jgi:lipoyl(octanoyl) transferase